MNKAYQDEFYRSIGNRLKKEMEKRKLSIYRLSKKANVQFNTVEGIINGKPFRFHQMIWIADYIGISIDELLDRTTTEIFRGTLYGQEKKENGNTTKEENHQEESCQAGSQFI